MISRPALLFHKATVGRYTFTVGSSPNYTVIWYFIQIHSMLIPCWWKASVICTEGFWIKVDFLHEVIWKEGHLICKISLVSFTFRAKSPRSTLSKRDCDTITRKVAGKGLRILSGHETVMPHQPSISRSQGKNIDYNCKVPWSCKLLTENVVLMY